MSMIAKRDRNASGWLTEIVKAFVCLKRQQGYKFGIEEGTLFRFVRLGEKHDIPDHAVPDEMTREWFTRRTCEKPSTFHKRCGCVRQILQYAQDMGYDVDIPEIPRIRKEKYEPYIFTENEISRFFYACDTMPPYPGSRRHQMAPVLFRILYGCGLRASEAANLKFSDVDCDGRTIVVRDPKNHCDRIVPMDESLLAALRKYRDEALVGRPVPGDFFFAGKFNDHLTRGQIYQWFRMCLERAGISHRGKGLGPRTHDLRHTFCVHSLKTMALSGRDPTVFLPVLSAYVGHKSIDATQHYLRLTAELYPDVLAATVKYSGRAIPTPKEVHTHETN
jgi:integrase